MTISWPNLAIGSVLGAILGVIADWQVGTRFRKWSELRALTKQYGSRPAGTKITVSGMTERMSRPAGSSTSHGSPKTVYSKHQAFRQQGIRNGIAISG